MVPVTAPSRPGPGPDADAGYPIVSADPRAQAMYEHSRKVGDPHLAALSIAAHRVARRRVPLEPYRDDETIKFGFVNDGRSVSDDFDTLVRYWEMRLRGESHRFAEMMATRTFPGVKTDATFNRGRCNGNQFEDVPGLGEHHRRIAEAAGVSITGKHYCSGLADFPGDPTAWIGGRGDVLRIARAKGYRVRGEVEYDPGEREPMPDIPIAPEIVDEFVDEYMTLDSGERRADVEERMVGLLTGAVDMGPLRVEDPPAGWEDAS